MIQQATIQYRVRQFLSTNLITKYCCTCLKVVDKLKKPWKEMTPKEKRFRIKKLWLKASLIYEFEKMKNNNYIAKQKL